MMMRNGRATQCGTLAPLRAPRRLHAFYCSGTSSTRRFCARPSAVSLVATKLVLPSVRMQPRFGDSILDQVFLDRIGAPIGQPQIVFLAADHGRPWQSQQSARGDDQTVRLCASRSTLLRDVRARRNGISRPFWRWLLLPKRFHRSAARSCDSAQRFVRRLLRLRL
jgi:hypothetical protein